MKNMLIFKITNNIDKKREKLRLFKTLGGAINCFEYFSSYDIRAQRKMSRQKLLTSLMSVNNRPPTWG